MVHRARLIVQLNENAGTLSLQVSLDGYHFSEGQFPPTMRIDNKAYTSVVLRCCLPTHS